MILGSKVMFFPQLPKKKIRQIIEIENNEKAVKAEDKTWKSVCKEVGYDEALKQLEDGAGVAFNAMAGARKEVVMQKYLMYLIL